MYSYVPKQGSLVPTPISSNDLIDHAVAVYLGYARVAWVRKVVWNLRSRVLVVEISISFGILARILALGSPNVIRA